MSDSVTDDTFPNGDWKITSTFTTNTELPAQRKNPFDEPILIVGDNDMTNRDLLRYITHMYLEIRTLQQQCMDMANQIQRLRGQLPYPVPSPYPQYPVYPTWPQPWVPNIRYTQSDRTEVRSEDGSDGSW